MDEFTRRLLPPISGGSDADTLTETPPDAPGDTPDTPEPDVPTADPPAEPKAPAEPESFIDPSTLPPEIKSHWKRMHGTYSKKLEGIRAHQQDIDMLAKFRSDTGFALELLRYEAQRRGLVIGPANGTGSTPQSRTPAANDAAPPDLVEAIKAKLDPSLHWMAEGQAAAAWAAAQTANRPLLEKQRAKEQAERDTEWGSLTGKLTETAPGWEAHESDMNALLDWIRSPALTHERWGSKLEFLYNAVTNGSAAKRAAINDMAAAARNRVSTGQPARAAVPNVSERVRKAHTTHDAVKLAGEAAEQWMREQGLAVPD